MFDPFTSQVFVQGPVIQRDNGTLVIKFEKSSAFWDESDVGNIGSNLKITGVKNFESFQVGDVVTAKGELKAKSTIESTDVYQSRFEPLGIDWKFSAMIIFVLILALVIYGITRLFKNIRYLDNNRIKHRIS